MKGFIREYGLHLIAVILFIGGAIAIYFINNSIKDRELERRMLRLESVLQEAKLELQAGIENFAMLVSGFREYIENSEELPSTEELQRFINHQLEAVGRNDLIAVSFVDTNYIFRSSFTRTNIDPGRLVSTSLPAIRDTLEIQRLEKMMSSDDLRLLDPFNLLEGWAGLPLNFRIKQKGKVIGFMAPIIDVNTILNRIYSKKLNQEFAFRFRTSNGNDFDRCQVYALGEAYNQKSDPEYYTTFDIDPSEFISSSLKIYGIELTLGVAYKTPYQRNNLLTLLMYGAHILLSIFILIILRQTIRYNKLNKQLKKNNEIINEQKVQLEELNATKDKFFALVAHDMKAPIHSILGLVQLIKKERVFSNDSGQLVKYLDQTSKNTLQLLENLLEWAKLQTGKLIVKYELIDLAKTIKETIAVLQPLAEQKNIQINFKSDEEIFIKADNDILAAVIRNLVSNAIKFTPNNGTILIHTKNNIDQVIVAVNDNGMGMSEEEKTFIFKLGSKFSKTGTEGETGTGLGLLLCKEFVEAHQGSIWVESELGRGSTFYFSIPKSQSIY